MKNYHYHSSYNYYISLKSFLIPTIISQLDFKTSETQFLTLGDIKAKRDYVFIDDISLAFKSVINSDLPKGINVFNLSSAIPKSANDIILSIEKLFGLKVKVNVDKNLLRTDEESIEYGSFQKAKIELAWEPTISMEDGLKKTVKSSI